MNMKELSHNLQKIYQEMSETFSAYQTKTGWNCPPSCGKCCTNPDIEASVLEMLPMAFKIYEDGNVDEWMEKLANSSEKSCLAFIPGDETGRGRCGMYQERPSVCRMFGVAGYFDKKHEPTLTICRELREIYAIKNVVEKLNREEVPVIVDWTFKLAALNPDLIKDKLPLNQALLKALDKVALYSHFQMQGK